MGESGKVGQGYEERVKALIEASVDVLLVDSAHGFAKSVIETTKFVRRMYPNIQIIAGNIATGDAATALINAGADALRVGMGPGAICTTRIVSGMGVPQLTAILETVKVAKTAGVPVIADGGIKYSGDMVTLCVATLPDIEMTADHPVMVSSVKRVHRKNNRSNAKSAYEMVVSSTAWNAARR